MSLLSSIQIARNSLLATQLGLQVTGNNIANADTPGYIRERLEVATAPAQRQGRLILGTGVQVEAVSQQIDQYLEQRLRLATSDAASAAAQSETYVQLESLLQELGDADLSTALTTFFDRIHDVLNQPEDRTLRQLVAVEGQALADRIRWLDGHVQELQQSLDDRIRNAAGDVNRLLGDVARLNRKIVEAESGGWLTSDAVGLRDQRYQALSQLAELMNIRAEEQPDGAVNLFVGGEYLVFGPTLREVAAVRRDDGDHTATELVIQASQTRLPVSSGTLAGWHEARDEILGSFLHRLSDVTRHLIFEFNRLHAAGQGLTGFDHLTSDFAVANTAVPLDQAGLSFTPQHGSFQVQVRHRSSGLVATTDIFVNLDGLDDDTSLQGLATALDAIDGVAASLTADHRLQLLSEAPELELAFANDTSGVLAALGLNTFFVGDSSATIGVHRDVRADPARFAASRSGVAQDSENAVRLAAFLDTPLAMLGGQTIVSRYESMVAETAQSSASAQAVHEGVRSFQQTLQGQKLAVSGVSLDEEAVQMLVLQRAFQASAKLITTINELLEVLVNL